MKKYNYNDQVLDKIPIASNASDRFMQCPFLKFVELAEYGKLYYCNAGRAIWMAQQLIPELRVILRCCCEFNRDL